MRRRRRGEMKRLPVECASHIIGFTSAGDACRSCAVSRLFKHAADSDIVWDRLLPPHYKHIISQSPSSSSLFSMPKKDLYFHLCTHPIIIANGHMSFALDRQSGKICYMVGARGLSIAWADTPTYWQWMTLPHSRFSEVAKLKLVWWLDIKACIWTKNLSAGTTYAAYLVYQLSEVRSGLARTPIVLRINYQQSAVVSVHRVILDPMPQRARHRGDGWMEIEMGQFFIEQKGNDDAVDVVECSVTEVDNLKSGLIVEGIELRPVHM
ncbi:putative F-box protein PP2-B12 [Argentina anserina]|uniref:putative F-box protein PP2-B12 n=1 Tax=Argentina anserina TaxID=57926 RepID=UPI0021764A0B|nr:putative F-box protein PP2-B12 [Potentilla anserina]